MEQQNQINTEKLKKTYWRFVFGFLAIIVLVGGGFFVWEKYLSPQAKIDREAQKNYQKYLDWQANYEKAMREDTYGGKTPQETLDLFIEALRKEDIELASKYFQLETDTQDPDYLTRKKWEELLRIAKEEERLGEIIGIVSRAIPTESQGLSENTFWFSIYNTKGDVELLIELSRNSQSKVWKIINI